MDGVKLKVTSRYVSAHLPTSDLALVFIWPSQFCIWHVLYVQVIIKHDIFALTLSNPDGHVTGVRYNGVDNLMEILNKDDNRGYQSNFFYLPFFMHLLASPQK